MASFDQPAFWDELVRLRPVGGCAMRFCMDRKHHGIFCCAAVTLVVDQVSVWFAGAAAAAGCEETQCLFDDGCGVWEVIREMGLLLEQGWHCGQLSPQHLVVFRADVR